MQPQFASSRQHGCGAWALTGLRCCFLWWDEDMHANLLPGALEKGKRAPIVSAALPAPLQRPPWL
eukprot:366490-Chlamydomonas_euryale.AAC.37